MKSIMSIKNGFAKVLHALLLTVILLGTGNSLFAHFGTKGPFGGSVSCGILDSSGRVILGTLNGGVYTSTTTTVTAWSARVVGIKSAKITALAHTYNNTTFYGLVAGTADSGVYIFTGLIGSERHWVKINTGLTNLKIKSLVTINSTTILAGTDGGGLFKTVNQGATWTAINSAPLNSAVITGMVRAGARILLTTSAGGVFKSDDNGDTWSDFNDASTLNITGTNALAYNAGMDQVLILNSNGLFVAGTASTIGTPVYAAAQTGLPANTAVRSISSNSTNWYLATDKGVYTTLTSSVNWATVAANAGLPTLDVNTVVPFGTSLVAGTNKEGICKFDDIITSPSWTSVNTGFSNLVTYSMAVSGEKLTVAANEKGVFVCLDVLATTAVYTRSNTGLTDSLNVTDLQFFGTKLYAATKNAGVFVSADTGKTWAASNTGLTGTNFKKVYASASYVYVFSSTGTIYNSTGTSWTAIQTGLPGTVVPTSLAFFGSKVLLGTLGDGVYLKAESASLWTSYNSGLSNLNVTGVTAFGGKIYAGTDGAGVFVSDALSVSWSATAALSISHTTTMGLNATKVQAMGTYGGYVFASYKGGLVCTRDNGVTWEEGGNQFNLPSFTDVNKIAFISGNATGSLARVFVTTENNGLYSNALSEIEFNAGIDLPVNPTCNSVCNGSAVAVATGVTTGTGAPYSYSWSNGQTGNIATGLCAGVLTVTVTTGTPSVTPISIVRSVTITAPAVLTATLTSTPSTGTDGSATASVSGGTANYTYLWNNNGTTAVISGLVPGDYTVTVTDVNGCSLVQSVNVANTSGISDVNSAIGNFGINPNPAIGHFMISLENIESEIRSIVIYDGLGRVMQDLSEKRLQIIIPVSITAPAGIYYVHVSTDNGTSVQKVVLK